MWKTAFWFFMGILCGYGMHRGFHEAVDVKQVAFERIVEDTIHEHGTALEIIDGKRFDCAPLGFEESIKMLMIGCFPSEEEHAL